MEFKKLKNLSLQFLKRTIQFDFKNNIILAKIKKKILDQSKISIS